MTAQKPSRNAGRPRPTDNWRTPLELLRAQFGRFAESYDLSVAKTKSAKVRLIGNSVCPEVAEALVRANVAEIRFESEVA